MGADLVEPSKPQNSYWLWLGENREKIAKELGSVKGSEVGKLAGQRWKAMPEAAKKPFEARAAELKKDYEKQMEAFLAAGGVKGKRRAEKAEAKAAKTGRGEKKARKEARASSGQPKKPQTAYFLYLNDNREAIQKELGSKALPQVTKLAAERWKALGEAQKKPYEAKAAAAKAEYEKAMAEWKEKQGEGEDEEEDGEEGEEDQ
jgi:high mobility group protein B3